MGKIEMVDLRTREVNRWGDYWWIRKLGIRLSNTTGKGCCSVFWERWQELKGISVLGHVVEFKGSDGSRKRGPNLDGRIVTADIVS
jgi:hypothetical protein